MTIEAKANRLPSTADMVREIRRQDPEEGRRLLAAWMDRTRALGRLEGMAEGLKRGREPVLRTTVSALVEAGEQRAVEREG